MWTLTSIAMIIMTKQIVFVVDTSDVYNSKPKHLH